MNRPLAAAMVSAVVIAAIGGVSFMVAQQSARSRDKAEQTIREGAAAARDLDRAAAEAVEQALRPDQGWEDTVLGSFQATDQNGVAVDQAMLEGQVTIASFFFSNCTLACPMISARMFELSDRLKATDVRFVSFSVDPKNDTQQALREYADKWGVADERWRFLMGKEGVVSGLLEGVGFNLQNDASQQIQLPDGSVMDNIIHPPQLFLIGPQRQVLAIYPVDNPSQVDALERRARLLAGAR